MSRGKAVAKFRRFRELRKMDSSERELPQWMATSKTLVRTVAVLGVVWMLSMLLELEDVLGGQSQEVVVKTSVVMQPPSETIVDRPIAGHREANEKVHGKNDTKREDGFLIGSVEWFEAKVGVNSRPQRPRDPPPLKTQSKPSQCASVEPIKKLPLVVVVSNRRSGTHMSMDMVHNVFEEDKVIMKANHIAAIEGELSCECRDWLHANAKIIHVGRNLLDVVVSMYYYRSQFDINFRRTVSWKQYLQSKFLNQVIRRWVHTEHSWFIDTATMATSFERTASMDRAHLEEIADYLGMGMSPNPAVYNRKNWNIISHPVWTSNGKGKGKGAGGFKTLMTPEDRKRILDKALANPIWRYDTLLTCPVKEYKHNQICVHANGDRSIIQNEKRCVSIGSPKALRPLSHGGRQSYFCIPRSCPNDLVMGNTYTKVGNKKTLFNKHASLLAKKKNTLTGPPFNLAQLSMQPATPISPE